MTPEHRQARYKKARYRILAPAGVKMGSLFRAVYDKGGDDLPAWLVDNTPEGGSLSETMAAIAMDAMAEEKETA